MPMAVRLIVLLAVLNAEALYYHQWRSGYWLPRQDHGKWRASTPKTMKRFYARRMAANRGYDDYSAAPPDVRNEIDAEVAKHFPQAEMERMVRRNEFRHYVGSFGMWQFPLSILALFTTVVSTADDVRRRLPEGVFLSGFSMVLFVDALYRSYFGALGW